MHENIFNFFKKESTRSFLKASGKTLAVGSGIACLFNMIAEIFKEKGNRNSGVIWGNFAGALACGGIYLGLDINERKNLEHKTKTETQARKEIIEAEADAYEKKRQADAELYDAKAKTDVWKSEKMREFKRSDDESDNSCSTTTENECVDDFKEEEPLPPIGQDQDFANELDGDRLFDIIIHKGEIGMIFGPKGCGKSIVTDWIALNIADGKNIPVFEGVEENAIAETTVLDYDLELNDKDIYRRFGKYGFQFPENFIRHDKTQVKSTEDILFDIYKNVKQAHRGDEIFSVIDTITKVGDITCSQSIKQFLENLEKITHEASSKGIILTTLLVSHPTKDCKPGDSLELSDAAGSTDLTRFLNYVIAIESTRISKEHIILKALNIRGEIEPENVVILKIENEVPFVHPIVLCEMDEGTALKLDKKQFEAYLEGLDVKSEDTTDKRKVNKTGLTDEDKHEIFRLHKEKGKSPEELAKIYGPKCKTGTISDTTIRNFIREIEGKNKSDQPPIA